MSKDQRKKKKKKDKKAAKGASTLKALAQNPLVADLVASALVATAALWGRVICHSTLPGLLL